MSGVNLPAVNASVIAAIRGPIIMITVGTLFLLQKFNILQFGQTWPVILIVVGALALAGGRRSRWQDPDAAASGPSMMPPNVPPYVPPPPPPGVRR